MTPEEVLSDLLERLGSNGGSPILVGEQELAQWPQPIEKALTTQGSLAPAAPAQTVVCPGCEEACIVPVHALADPSRPPRTFIVCDRRQDVNRILVPRETLSQRQCSREAVIQFVTRSLGLRVPHKLAATGKHWELGVVRGNKRGQMLCLSVDGALELTVGNQSALLANLIRFADDGYDIDSDLIRQWADDTTVADPRYTPTTARRDVRKLETQAKYRAWQQLYLKLRHQYPNRTDVWYSEKIAKSAEGQAADSETIRKRMK